MILIFTLDDNNGTNLAGKRQSKDRIVGDKIIALANDHLHILDKTVSFFKNNNMSNVKYTVISDVRQLPQDAVFFSEEVLPKDILMSADKIYVFRWNQQYPSLLKDRLDLSGYNQSTLETFPGYSHNNITLEVYFK